MRTALEGLQETPPDWRFKVAWPRREVWSLPVLDRRGDDEILGYNEHGLFD
jgi:hypothetical protein